MPFNKKHGRNDWLSIIFVDMDITPEMINNLAHLSRLEFSEAEKKSIGADLQKIVAFVEKLQELDTSGVMPLLHISDAANVLRDDELGGSVTRSEALMNAPVKDEMFFKVPKVIKK